MRRDTGALSLMLLAMVLLTAILIISDRALTHSPRSAPDTDLGPLQNVSN
jgi:hypothetical protein